MLKVRYATESLSDYESFKSLHEDFRYAEHNPNDEVIRETVVKDYVMYSKYAESENVFFAILEGKVIGYAIMSVENDAECKIEEIYIKSEMQRCGYGRSFVNQIKEVAKGEGFTKMELISANLTTDQIWTRLGFKPTRFTDDTYKIELK